MRKNKCGSEDKNRFRYEPIDTEFKSSPMVSVDSSIEKWVIDPLTQGGLAAIFSKVLSYVKVIGPAFKGTVTMGAVTMYPAIAVGVTSVFFNYVEKGFYIIVNSYSWIPRMSYREQYAVDLLYVTLASIGLLGLYRHSLSNIGKINVLGSNTLAIYGKDLVMDLFIDRGPGYTSTGKGYTLDDLGY
jgi:hypothetical protein